MKLYDLKNNNKKFIFKIYKNFNRLFRNGNFIFGKEVFELEKNLKKFTGSKYCISTSSGTDALYLSLLALEIKKDDEIITTPFTFVSTVEVILLLGAKPVFTDIDPDTFNMNENQIFSKITKKTKAIIPVSLFGQSANLRKINKIAKKYNLPVIEDASQSFGASHHEKKSCNLSTIGVTSFFPTKPLGCYGDGGAIFTNNKNLAVKLTKLRNHGQQKKYKYDMVGINGRLDTIQAIILIEKLKLFKSDLKIREKIAMRYHKLFVKNKKIKIPFIKNENKSSYAQYSIILKSRNKLVNIFKKNKVPFGIYYPKPIYFFKPYKKFKKGTYPVTERICKNIISLPIHTNLTQKEQNKIAKLVSEI